MAGSDAGFAAGALVEIHLEGILLAVLRSRERNQIAIVAGLLREFVIFVALGKPGYGAEQPLFLDQGVDQGAFFERCHALTTRESSRPKTERRRLDSHFFNAQHEAYS